MGATRVPHTGSAPPAPSDAEAEFRDLGPAPTSWSNAAGAVYATHEHGSPEWLCRVSGSITFHTPAGDIALGSGDRLEMEPHTPHRATVGDACVTCVEAPVGTA